MPGRIDADIFQHYVRTRRERRGHDKKGGRGKIGRDAERTSLEPSDRAEGEGISQIRGPARERLRKGRQQALGVIAGGPGFDEAGLAPGIKPGQ